MGIVDKYSLILHQDVESPKILLFLWLVFDVEIEEFNFFFDRKGSKVTN